MGTYRRSDGKEREGFSPVETTAVQSMLWDAKENLDLALGYLDGEDTKVDSVEFELLNVQHHVARAMLLTQAAIERGEEVADE